MTKIQTLYVEVCVFKKRKNKIRFLVLKRSSNDKIFPGINQIITGTIDTIKCETALDAALRELYEETHLKPINFWVLPMVNSYYVVNKDFVNISPMFVAEVDWESEPILSSEHESYQWCNLNKTIRALIWEGHRKAIKILYDYLIGKDIWGENLKINIS